MPHGAVGGVGVGPQVGAVLFGVGEGFGGYAPGAFRRRQAVKGGVGRFVQPASPDNDAVGGFDARHQCEGAGRLPFMQHDKGDSLRHILLQVFQCWVADPLHLVPVGAHHGAGMAVHLHHGGNVGSGGRADGGAVHRCGGFSGWLASSCSTSSRCFQRRWLQSQYAGCRRMSRSSSSA